MYVIKMVGHPTSVIFSGAARQPQVILFAVCYLQ